MPNLDGTQATGKLKAQYPAIQVIMLTVFDEEDMVFQAILAGANGYLLKDEPVANIIRAVREVENGGAQMSPEIALKAFNFLRNNTSKFASKENKPIQTIAETPTKRELEVLQAIAKGLSYQETADALFISLDTVRSHLRKVYAKLYANNKIEAITKAQKRGWI